ncbi:GPI mannosyltransferase 3-like [Leptopilina heterotoma]|uniref:GPI mannosyltransferase 3-like n=1 Tax=Leptopilina heterotoma TaxID=63436 RepID=UPI001CAA292B|nr:GPI mannosyltransferase 3-like isoform X1 [Leptopilina heterotoma]XP_043482552.1 GPI mannosyltransferase 3-like [Leptopilina heterotoma]
MGIGKVRSVLFLLIIWRLCSVFVVQTFHVPDEYWQSLEVAHKLTFNYGHLTWEWTERIRSYIYPFLISILYNILHFLSIDYTILLIYLPRIFQSLLTAYSDYRFYIWSKSKWSLFILSINWYWYYCSTRTLINSFETSLTIIALSHFPWREKENNYFFLWIVGLLFTIRPTSAIIWLPLCVYHICTRSKISILINYFLIGITCLTISTFIDSFCYGNFVITPWEFFKMNVWNNISKSYGVENHFWYFLSALPVLLGIEYFTLISSVWRIFRHWRQFHCETILLITCFWTILVYSCLEHKEFRFILPLLPIFIFICNSRNYERKRISELRRKLFLGLFIVSNLIPGVYFSLIHQKGSLNSLEFLRNNLNQGDDILFLTPCHSTPLYSHLHKNVSTRFLKCEPNLNNTKDYIEEAQQFFANPQKWIDENYTKGIHLPTFLVIYDNFQKQIQSFLLTNYREIYKTFDCHFPQKNYGNYMIVYKKNHPG